MRIAHGFKKEGLLRAKSTVLGKTDEGRRGTYRTTMNEGPIDCLQVIKPRLLWGINGATRILVSLTTRNFRASDNKDSN